MGSLANRKQSPLYQKAQEIFKLTHALIEIIPKDNEFLQETCARFMMEDSMMLTAKIAGAEAVELYDLKMENAAIIRKCARELYVRAGSLRFEEDIQDKEYIELLRSEIEEFRLLFIDWVATFDPWNYIIDRWGLFNPPGVSAHDKDPDDDLPFDANDFFDKMNFDEGGDEE